MTRTNVLIFVSVAFFVITSLAPQYSVAGASTEVSERDKTAAGKALIAAKNAKWIIFRRHQKAIRSPVLKKALSWHLFSAANSGANFHEIAGFLRENSHWPHGRKLQIRAEEVMPHFAWENKPAKKIA